MQTLYTMGYLGGRADKTLSDLIAMRIPITAVARKVEPAYMSLVL